MSHQKVLLLYSSAYSSSFLRAKLDSRSLRNVISKPLTGPAEQAAESVEPSAVYEITTNFTISERDDVMASINNDDSI